MKLVLLASLFITTWSSLTAAQQVDPNKLIKEKERIRDRIRAHAATRTAFPTVRPNDDDLAENLVDELKYDSLAAMETAGLEEAALPATPWSDSYWPIYQGEIAVRYADPNFPASQDWQKNVDYLSHNLYLPQDIAIRSPSEKYDILVGDKNFTLTKALLEVGKPFYKATGSVETWMGICHGWAPASYMESRPQRTIQVLAADRRTWINFNPSDIKALTSLLWAEGEFTTKFIGGRCERKEGRDQPDGAECQDTNPATWHLAVVNQIGVAKRSLILDTASDFQVWNQPVSSYRYRLINPKSGKQAKTLEEAAVTVANYPDDPFKKSRADGTKYIVGIRMLLTYTAETEPSTSALIARQMIFGAALGMTTT